jgi:hypothetical protein
MDYIAKRVAAADPSLLTQLGGLSVHRCCGLLPRNERDYLIAHHQPNLHASDYIARASIFEISDLSAW